MDGVDVADWILLIFAFVMGLTVSGVVASALGAASDQTAGFHAPFVQRRHLLRSLTVTMFAGPIMMINDAISAYAGRRIRPVTFAACLVFAGGWALALGILATELAWRAGILLS